MNNDLDPLVNECANKEQELMKQFGETDSNEFNYDTCCLIFRHLIEQVEKENKVNFKTNFNFFLFDIFIGTRKTCNDE